MKPHAQFRILLAAVALSILLQPATASAEHKPAASISESSLIQPAELAALLQNKSLTLPLILQVGSRVLFDEAHIAGAEYAGPGGQADGLKALRSRVTKLPKDASIVLYCGCCPWSKCPNIAAAYDELKMLGFTHMKVLYIAENFGANWVEAGYPVAAGG